MLGLQTYVLHEPGAMTVRANRSVGYVVVSILIGVCAVLFLGGRTVALIVFVLCAAFSVISFRRVGETLVVRPNTRVEPTPHHTNRAARGSRATR